MFAYIKILFLFYILLYLPLLAKAGEGKVEVSVAFPSELLQNIRPFLTIKFEFITETAPADKDVWTIEERHRICVDYVNKKYKEIAIKTEKFIDENEPQRKRIVHVEDTWDGKTLTSIRRKMLFNEKLNFEKINEKSASAIIYPSEMRYLFCKSLELYRGLRAYESLYSMLSSSTEYKIKRVPISSERDRIIFEHGHEYVVNKKFGVVEERLEKRWIRQQEEVMNHYKAVSYFEKDGWKIPQTVLYTGKGITSKRVVRERITIIPESVAINEVYPADFFRAKFPPGTPIWDEIKQLSYKATDLDAFVTGGDVGQNLDSLIQAIKDDLNEDAEKK